MLAQKRIPSLKTSALALSHDRAQDPRFRAPSWAEVKDFTTRLRRLRCPVKIRYSAGKQEGTGCGQLSAEAIATPVTGGHLVAPPGIFTG